MDVIVNPWLFARFKKSSIFVMSTDSSSQQQDFGSGCVPPQQQLSGSGCVPPQQQLSASGCVPPQQQLSASG